LVGLCNTPLIIKIYVINPEVFSSYLEKGNAASLHPSDHEQYPFDKIGQNESTHGVLHGTPNAGIVIHLGFGLVMRYPS
jgi:hypothetical protein